MHFLLSNLFTLNWRTYFRNTNEAIVEFLKMNWVRAEINPSKEMIAYIILYIYNIQLKLLAADLVFLDVWVCAFYFKLESNAVLLVWNHTSRYDARGRVCDDVLRPGGHVVPRWVNKRGAETQTSLWCNSELIFIERNFLFCNREKIILVVLLKLVKIQFWQTCECGEDASSGTLCLILCASGTQLLIEKTLFIPGTAAPPLLVLQ